MDDSAPKQPQKQFRVKLVQREWITTEQFVYDDVDSEQHALERAQAFVDAEKNFGTGVEYRLEAEEIVPEATESPAAPTE